MKKKLFLGFLGSVLIGLLAFGTIASGSVFAQTGYDHGADHGAGRGANYDHEAGHVAP